MNKNEKTILTKIEASKDIFTYLADAARLFDERSVGQKIKGLLFQDRVKWESSWQCAAALWF